MRQALEFLHDMGVCLYFERLNLVVTDPQWLASTFATLITFSHNWVKDGIVSTADLTHVYRGMSQEDILLIMNLFRSFQIAFPKVSHDQWVIPSMLRPTRNLSKPIDFAAFDMRFERHFRLDVVPLGLFGRVIARVQEWNDIQVIETWLTGVQVKCESQVAEVRERD